MPKPKKKITKKKVEKSQQYTNEEVYTIVDLEGLGYAVQNYMDGDRIKDQKLANLWDQAQALLNEIEEYLEEYA